jgi:hypothetical protein
MGAGKPVRPAPGVPTSGSLGHRGASSPRRTCSHDVTQHRPGQAGDPGPNCQKRRGSALANSHNPVDRERDLTSCIAIGRLTIQCTGRYAAEKGLASLAVQAARQETIRPRTGLTQTASEGGVTIQAGDRGPNCPPDQLEQVTPAEARFQWGVVREAAYHYRILIRSSVRRVKKYRGFLTSRNSCST